jgi:hypothetical protein
VRSEVSRPYEAVEDILEQHQELTYFEYWLAKDVWSLTNAIWLLTMYYILQRSWGDAEDFGSMVDSYRSKILRELISEDAKGVFLKRHARCKGFDSNDIWAEDAIVEEESYVKPREFISWVHDNGYLLPFEFKAFIKVEEKVKSLNEKQQQRNDREVCQGIAKTLWDIYPDMTIEDMQYRKEIQVYGSGKLYSTDTTLRRWLSDVDQRKVKTGPKKKI